MTGYTLKTEIQLSTDGTTFADVTADVSVVTPVDINIGIPSASVDAHTAQPGTMTLFMRNSDNGSGLLGLYSPGHANALAGFEIGKRIRFSADSDILFNGWIDTIAPMPGTLGPRLTRVDASDWIKKASTQKLMRLDVETAIKSEAAAAAIVAGVNTDPIATSYGTGQETFAYALDDCKDEKTTALTALDKVAKSEFGWIYCKADGTFRFDNRSSRLTAPTWKHTFTEDDWQSIQVERSVDNILNWLEVTTNPRSVGTDYETLWSLSKPTLIAANSTITLAGRYTDPNQQVARISSSQFPAYFQAVNYAKNPSFEVNVTDDWALRGAGTVARDTAQYYIGTASAKITAGAGNTALGEVACVSVPNGATVTGSCRVRCSAAPSATQVGFSLSNPGVENFAEVWATAASNGAWEYLTLTYTNTTGVTKTIGLDLRNRFNDSAGITWFDACQLELRASASPYCDGAQGEGYAWDGTAHNSVSRCSPVAGTDFNFSSGETDTGDMNADLGILVDYGANQAEFTLTNNSASGGYVTKLLVRGYAIRLFDPAMSRATDSDSIAVYDKHPWQYDMPWQDDPLFGQSIADIIKQTFAAPLSLVTSLTYVPDTTTLWDLAKTIAVGDGIKVTSPVNGIADVGYFVNGIHWSIKKGDNVTVTYTLGLSFVSAYWLLEVAGASELGSTTFLGF